MKFNKNINYEILYKRKFHNTDELNKVSQYDLFISAFNDSQRVKEVFSSINSVEKHWIVFPEYDYDERDCPLKDDLKNIRVFVPDRGQTEGEIIRNYIKSINGNIENLKICIDITGFIRPHLLFILRYFFAQKVSKLDCLYTDPIKYVKSEDTTFSDDHSEVRQVQGFMGSHETDMSNDYLLIASGYDYSRIINVSIHKDNTKKVQIFGFPSLQPDMFQQNILKSYKASEETVQRAENQFIDEYNTIFAPANDPFITAKSISDFFKKLSKKEIITNLYISPLSTKVQTLGIALFYLGECLNSPVSVIFPFCKSYSKETTEGISKIWIFTIELDILR